MNRIPKIGHKSYGALVKMKKYSMFSSTPTFITCLWNAGTILFKDLASGPWHLLGNIYGRVPMRKDRRSFRFIGSSVKYFRTWWGKHDVRPLRLRLARPVSEGDARVRRRDRWVVAKPAEEAVEGSHVPQVGGGFACGLVPELAQSCRGLQDSSLCQVSSLWWSKLRF